jgi:hypothetical protein
VQHITLHLQEFQGKIDISNQDFSTAHSSTQAQKALNDAIIEEEKKISSEKSAILNPSTATRDAIEETLNLDAKDHVAINEYVKAVDMVWDQNRIEFLANAEAAQAPSYNDGDITASDLAHRTNITIQRATNNFTPQYYNLSKAALNALEQSAYAMDTMINALKSWSLSFSDSLLESRTLIKRFLKEESVNELIAEQATLVSTTSGAETLNPGTTGPASSNANLNTTQAALAEIKSEREALGAPMPRNARRGASYGNEGLSSRRNRRRFRNSGNLI